MQETLTFPTFSSPHHRAAFSHSYFTDLSEQCSTASTPFVSAPSSPGRGGGFFFSAPSSPHWSFMTSIAAPMRDYPSAIPIHWEKDHSTPRRSCEMKGKGHGHDEVASFLSNADFEFSARFSELDDPSMSPIPMSSANELFCNGQIKPLKLPGRAEHSNKRIITNERAFALQPKPFEFQNRVVASNNSMSAPDSPRFFDKSMSGPASPHPMSTFRHTTAWCSTRTMFELNRGTSICGSSTSTSAPQSPCFHMNRVHRAPSVVSTNGIRKSFDTSPQICEEVSGCEPACLGPAMQGCRYRREGSKDMVEKSKSFVLSLARRSQAGHRRTRSFSPLRIFHRTDIPSSTPPAGACTEVTPHVLPQESLAIERGSTKKWTLKDLLHRKSGGDNRSTSRSNSRTGIRQSATPNESALQIMEKIGTKSLIGGRSSSGSSQSSMSSGRSSSANDTYRGRAHVCHRTAHDNNAANNGGSKGAKIDLNISNKVDNMNNNSGKPKSASQNKIKPSSQKSNKACVSPHQMHYMMHKAKSDELRKRTFLPYRQGLLSCLGFSSRSYRTVSTISKALQSVSG